MSIEDNPYLNTAAGYFDKYNEAIQENFQEGYDYHKFLQITNKLFNNEDGKYWLEIMQEQLNAYFLTMDLSAKNSDLWMAKYKGMFSVIHQIKKYMLEHEEMVKQGKL